MREQIPEHGVCCAPWLQSEMDDRRNTYSSLSRGNKPASEEHHRSYPSKGVVSFLTPLFTPQPMKSLSPSQTPYSQLTSEVYDETK